MAQGTTGSITGTVTDPAGAVVPGASITVTQIENNAVHKVVSSAQGTYNVPQLPPGTYTIDVQSPSFKSFQQQKLALAIDQVAQINVQLEIGSANEAVVVTAAAPVIQTEDSSIGRVIGSEEIQNTPLNGRLSVIGLIALAPGVQNAGAQDTLANRGVTPEVGSGARSAFGAVGTSFDGTVNEEVALQRSEPEVPSLDAISQFKVITNLAPAEFNKAAEIIVVSASGTNQLHGGAFEFHRGKGTQAKTYSFTSPAPARSPYERNEYGANLSGPIMLPHLYDGRDKSFFFFAFEGFHLASSTASNTQQPTALERQGNFSEFLAGGICAPSATTSTLVKNPLTGQAYQGNIITSPLSKVDQTLLQLFYPMPTQPGCGINTYQLIPNSSDSKRYSLRLDHRISDRDQLRFTYLGAYYGPTSTPGTTLLQGGVARDGETQNNFIVGWTHTISPSLLVDSYVSYFHLPLYRTAQNYNVNVESIIPGLGPQVVEGSPQVSITNISGIGEAGGTNLDQNAQLLTTVTKVTARHTIKAGFSFLGNNYGGDSAAGPARGSYSFNGRYSGIAFADFLLGDPYQTSKPYVSDSQVREYMTQYGMFVQDDWKPLRNLTVNVGIRNDTQWFFDNHFGRNSLYIPSLKKVAIFDQTIPGIAIPQLVNGLPVALSSDLGLPGNVWDYLGRAPHMLAPRFGLAYQPMANTVVRAGFGIYYSLFATAYIESGPGGNLPFQASQTFTNTTSGAPAFTMDSGPFAATGAFAANPSASAQAHTTPSYAEQYNLTIEHQFPHAVDVRIAYVGQHNLKQNNQSGSGTVAPNINLAAAPVVGVSAQSTNLVQPFSGITLLNDPIFHTTDSSLQVGLRKRYQSGLAFGAEYQWVRVLGTENIENPNGSNVNDSYGPISGIAPQVLTLNYSYRLPFGRGQRFAGTANNFVDRLINGWQVSGITVFQGGQPFSVSYTAPSTPVGLVSGRANRVMGVPLYPAHKTRQMWFNPAAFAAPPTYTSGGVTYASYGNSAYNMLRGPMYQNWDINLEKNTRIHDRYNVQLRADAFNAFNHPNFATPNANISNTATLGSITSVSGTPGYEQRTVEFAAKFTF